MPETQCADCGMRFPAEPWEEDLCPACLLDLALSPIEQEEVEAGDLDVDAPTETAPAAAFLPGQVLGGRYRIRSFLGRGGMGEVFRAHDSRLGRKVAIKVIGRRIQDEPEMLDRFEQEARAASALNHPNIITVHDLGEEEGHPFIVMEFVEGESLRARLDEPFAVEEIVRLATQITEGLAVAHEAGIVHQDLKPENILLDGRGTARLLDFGVALFRAPDPQTRATIVSEARTLTADSMVGPAVGTVGYMAPEVLRGQGADHRSDQFALGAILYEMATGRHAFRCETPADGLAATLSEEPKAISDFREDLPDQLVELIERCLSKQPEERYAETAEILTALKGVRLGP